MPQAIQGVDNGIPVPVEGQGGMVPVDVNIVGGGASGGTSMVDKAGFTEGTSLFNPVGGVYNEAPAGDPAEDQGAAARITAKRALHANLRNSAGAEVGVAVAPVRTDPVGTTSQPVVGAAAHDAGVAGNPVLTGAEARDTLPAAVATGDAVRLQADRYGRQKIVGPGFTLASSDDTPIVAAANTAIIAAPGANLHLRVYYLHASNGGALTTDVMWRDGAAGVRRYRSTLPQFGQFGHNIKPGYWDLTSNTALYLTTTAAGSVHWTVEYEVVAD